MGIQKELKETCETYMSKEAFCNYLVVRHHSYLKVKIIVFVFVVLLNDNKNA